MSPGAQATTSTGLNYLLAEDNDNLRVPFKNGKTYKQKLEEEIKKRLKYKRQGMEFDKPLGPDGTFHTENPPKVYEAAEGGRIGFSKGKIAKEVLDKGRRGFMKAAGAAGAGIAALKTGLLGFGKEAAPVAKEVIETVSETAQGVPPYFFKLVDKIKSLGQDVTVGSSTMPRQKVTRYKDYELTENVATGSKEIKKIGIEDDMITKNEYMTYTKGQADETTKGKKPADDYEEVTEINSRIYKDNYNDPDYEDGIELKEILEEVGETVTKKADGGRIGFSKGKLAKKIIEFFGGLKKSKKLNDDEYQEFLDEVGGADQLEAYNFDGTVGDAQRIVKEQKEYMDDMFMEYKKGNLDPVAGDKSPARKKFLQNKLDEMEASGDKRLMTTDEIEELSSFDLGSEMDVAKSLAPKMVERLQLKQKYPGITDDLLDKILIDDNVQRKAEVIATMDEALKMMEKGKGSDEIIETFKNVTRTKQAAGGLTTMLGE
jgi:hypothetical protein